MTFWKHIIYIIVVAVDVVVVPASTTKTAWWKILHLKSWKLINGWFEWKSLFFSFSYYFISSVCPRFGCKSLWATSIHRLFAAKTFFEITISAAKNAYIFFLNDQFMAVYKVTKCHGEQNKLLSFTIYKPNPNAFKKLYFIYFICNFFFVFLFSFYIFCIFAAFKSACRTQSRGIYNVIIGLKQIRK